TDDREARARDEGVVLLDKFRGGRRGQPDGPRSDAWADIEAALIDAQSSVEAFNGSLSARTHGWAADINSAFAADRALFAKILGDRYRSPRSKEPLSNADPPVQ